MPGSSAIQQSLSRLLPSHTSKLPPQLVHLAESLLAQSRQRASHLKPEEEIARAFACSEIACKRLRAQCRLPAVKAGTAPCKPAVYKKLVAFLERVLDENVNVTTTPTPSPKKQQVKATAASGTKRTASQAKLDSESDVAPENNTPSKTPRKNNTTPSNPPRSNNTQSTPNNGNGNAFSNAISGKKNNNCAHDPETEAEAPAFVMPSIRKLCKTFATRLLAPHVYTGTSVVLKLTGLWPPPIDGNEDEGDIDETVMGLVIALYLMTLTRMQTAKMTASVYKATCAKAVQVLDYKPGTDGVEAWIRRINREGYCRGQDWWASVPESVFEFDPPNPQSLSGGRRGAGAKGRDGLVDGVAIADGDEEEEEEEEENRIISTTSRRPRSRDQAVQGAEKEGDNEDDEEDPEGVLLPGLATMMQHAVDFASEDRTHDYEVWKRALLRKLDRLDKSKASNTGRGRGRARGRERTATSRVSAGRSVAVK